MDHLVTAKLLDTQRTQLVDQAVAMALQNPFWKARYGPGIGERLALDSDLNLATLAKAIRYRSPMVINDHVLWRRNQIVGFGCSSGHLREIFGYTWAAISAALPPEVQPTIYDYIQSAMQALTYPSAEAQAVSSAHELLAEALTAASFDPSWHWQAAYGSAGRPAALHENWFLIDYATDAIGARNDAILATHVRYRRDTGYARGLTTLHTQQLLWLAADLAAQRLTPAAAAQIGRTLEAAAGMLIHEHASCRALLAAQDQIIHAVAGQLAATGMAPQPADAALEIGWQLAYLNDSLALGDPALLAGYTRWMQHALADQGLPDALLRESYGALAVALDRYLPQPAAADSRALIGAALRAL